MKFQTKIKKPLFFVIIVLFLFSLSWIWEAYFAKLKTFSSDLPKGDLQTIEKENPAVVSLEQKEGHYKVLKVVDGDTVDVEISGKSERIRLLGINTPETVDPQKPVECFGKEASNYTKSILQGKNVFLENDLSQQDRDKYGRLLRYIFLEDGALFNKKIIEEGFAYEYTHDPPYKYQTEFQQAQAEAMNLKRGLWADGVCTL